MLYLFDEFLFRPDMRSRSDLARLDVAGSDRDQVRLKKYNEQFKASVINGGFRSNCVTLIL
jgi:hypothetical protein